MLNVKRDQSPLYLAAFTFQGVFCVHHCAYISVYSTWQLFEALPSCLTGLRNIDTVQLSFPLASISCNSIFPEIVYVAYNFDFPAVFIAFCTMQKGRFCYIIYYFLECGAQNRVWTSDALIRGHICCHISKLRGVFWFPLACMV